mgnify:CR=1 FL=1
MGNIISTELLKIKRYSVVKAGLVMMSLSVFNELLLFNCKHK